MAGLGNAVQEKLSSVSADKQVPGQGDSDDTKIPLETSNSCLHTLTHLISSNIPIIRIALGLIQVNCSKSSEGWNQLK